MRYVNIAKVVAVDGSVTYLDLDLVSTTPYTPLDASRNGMNGRFAQISFAANTDTGLRVYVRKSCATADSCSYCDDAAYNPTDDQRKDCYAAGCGCFGYRAEAHTVPELVNVYELCTHCMSCVVCGADTK